MRGSRQCGPWHSKLGPSREGEPLHQDFKDLLSEFEAEKVRYLLIGGYAVAFHSFPRFTKDLDLFVDPAKENLSRVYRALAKFGAPSHVLDSLLNLKPTEVLWMGNPPVRIDILQTVDGVEFETAFQRKIMADWHDTKVSVISKVDLIASKRAAGRPQDLLDVENLEQSDEGL